MSKQSRREVRRSQYRRQQLRSYVIWGAVGLGVLSLLGVLIWNSVRPAAGEEVPLMASREHVPEGTDPGPHNTDPPTSGPHYAITINPGFYDEGDLDSLGEFPEGYLIHNLEHGYIVFWYDCEELAGDCGQLKTQIRQVLEEFDNFKVVAVPWDHPDVPVVLTSWGRMLRMESFNAGTARDFVQRNRNRAPEPAGA